MAIKDGDTIELKDGSKGFVLLASKKVNEAIVSLDKKVKKYPIYDKEVNAVIVPFADIKAVLA